MFSGFCLRRQERFPVTKNAAALSIVRKHQRRVDKMEIMFLSFTNWNSALWREATALASHHEGHGAHCRTLQVLSGFCSQCKELCSVVEWLQQSHRAVVYRQIFSVKKASTNSSTSVSQIIREFSIFCLLTD